MGTGDLRPAAGSGSSRHAACSHMHEDHGCSRSHVSLLTSDPRACGRSLHSSLAAPFPSRAAAGLAPLCTTALHVRRLHMAVSVAAAVQLRAQPARRSRAATCAAATPGAPQRQRSAASRISLNQRGAQTGGGRRGGGSGGGSGGGERLDVDCCPAWRVFEVAVPADIDPGKDDFDVHDALLAALARKLRVRSRGGSGGSPAIAADAVRIVRKSFDARNVQRSGEVAG